MKGNMVKKDRPTNSTNYPIDSHNEFCKRCMKHNGFCVNTKTQRKDPTCKL